MGDSSTPNYMGYVDERSPHHLVGWVCNQNDFAERVAFDVVEETADGPRILQQGTAQEYNQALVTLRVGDGRYGFIVFLLAPVADAAALTVRVRGDAYTLPIAPKCTGLLEPVGHMAMDIVNNCNLRCPFCLYDYEGLRTTQFMDGQTFASALRMLPYVTAGNFWLSCLHEATLHPQLLAFIDMIPMHYRDRVMYTTNLAKRMPDAYFTQLAGSGLHHLNISVESLVPATYERLRKGARFSIFKQNWDKMLSALAAGSNPPRLRYNMMAYRSNLQELPGLVALLLAEKQAWQVELRYTFDEAHIPAAFRQSEYLDEASWDWLAAQLAHHDPERVLLMRPPAPAPGQESIVADAPAMPKPPTIMADTRPTYPLGIRVDWDGTMHVYSQVVQPNGMPQHTNHLVTNVNAIQEPADMIGQLLARA